MKPEEIVEELFGEKRYRGAHPLDTKEIVGWNQECASMKSETEFWPRTRFVTIAIIEPIKCKGLWPPENLPECQECKIRKIVEARRVMRQHFLDVFEKIIKNEVKKIICKFGLDEDSASRDDGSRLVCYETSSWASYHKYFIYVDNNTITISVEMPKAKEIAIEILKAYFDAHKDCCEW